ncbi:MAG: heme o synthase [Candidatus Contendobacter sp.]
MLTTAASLASIRSGHWRDYLELTKPKVVALMIFTALVGMLLATPDWVPWPILLFGSLGIALLAGSAAALNHLADCGADAVMARTCRRPLPSGHLDTSQVLVFALVLGLLGLGLLLVFTNRLTAVLTTASLLGYAVIYTRFLKRATPQNIVIGGAAGAAPPLLGWTAVTGQLDSGALLLFLIIYVWTPPHFWALAIHRCQDYTKADIPMLPVTHGIAFTRLQILLYTWLLLPISLLPFLTGMSGVLYLVGALLLSGRFLGFAIRWFVTRDDRLAMPTFRFSIVYLFSLFAALMVDHYANGPLLALWHSML